MSNLQSTIADQNKALEGAQKKLDRLKPMRTAALELGNNREVDELDSQIRTTQTELERGAERIKLLEAKLADEKAAAHGAWLDSLAQEAIKASALGQKIITAEYGPRAAEIATMMKKLLAIDSFVDDVNRQLQAQEREQVKASNTVRCRPLRYEEKKVRRMVGIGEPEHPNHKTFKWNSTGNAIDTNTGQPVQAWLEMDVTERVAHGAVMHAPLPESVVLPTVSADDSHAWHWAESRRPTPEQQKDTLKSLGINSDIKSPVA